MEGGTAHPGERRRTQNPKTIYDRHPFINHGMVVEKLLNYSESQIPNL